MPLVSNCHIWYINIAQLQIELNKRFHPSEGIGGRWPVLGKQSRAATYLSLSTHFTLHCTLFDVHTALITINTLRRTLHTGTQRTQHYYLYIKLHFRGDTKSWLHKRNLWVWEKRGMLSSQLRKQGGGWRGGALGGYGGCLGVERLNGPSQIRWHFSLCCHSRISRL